MASSPAPRTLDLLALGALSAAVLAFEIILLRLFEFSHWHYFAGLTIALALLGLGTAGTVLALVGDRATRAGDRWFACGMLVAAGGFLVVLWLNSQFALRPLFAAWDAGELARVLAIDFAAFLPFFGAGLAIGQVFPRWPAYPTRLYSANLFGGGFGSIMASLLVSVMSPESALALVAAVLAVAALALGLLRRLPAAAVAAVVLLVPAGFFIYAPPEPEVSDFKALARLTELPDTEIVSVQPGLSGRMSVLRGPSLRFAPGLSLNWTDSVPVSDAAVIGSDRVVPIARDYRRVPAHAEASLIGLPLSLRPAGTVLAIGSSTWATPLMAAGHDLTWVEPDRRLSDLVLARGAGFTVVTDGAYRHLATDHTAYDLIALDRAFAVGDAASEDNLLTVEGLRLALRRLRPAGMLAIGVELDYPPRQGPRMLSTIAAALADHGVEHPGEHVAALRGMQAMLVLAASDPMAPDDIAQIREYARRWSFDPVWLPGMDAAEANRNHVLDEPVFYRAARAAFEGTAMPGAAQWFETRPATLNRPYFWRAMKWNRLPELFDALGHRAASLLDWTLVMSLAAMVLVTLLAAALILLPLRRLPPMVAPHRRVSVAGYFLALGLGFMLIEMAVFQRAILYLDRPVLAAAVVFALFLIGAGIGSAMPPKRAARSGVRRIFGALALGIFVTVTVLWLATDWLLATPLGMRVALISILLLPMTWAMGRPFPWALGRLSGQPRWIPWGWGINGFASVAAASLAPLVSVHFGQPATLLAGTACYVVVWSIARGWVRAG